MLHALGTFFVTLGLTISGWFGVHPAQPLGANSTISNLPELTSLDGLDVFTTVDTSEATTKKLKWNTATSAIKTILDAVYSPIFSTSAGFFGLISDETGNAGGVVRATSPTLTTPTINSPTLDVAGTDATGDIYYNSGSGLLTRLPIGSSNEFLRVSGGLPDWDNTALLTNPQTSSSTFTATTTFSGVFIGPEFGGTGSDGALSITSGTTTINLGSNPLVVKNYSSISITGTGALEFSNPATQGTIIILKSQNDCTLTSSANPLIDLRRIGSASSTGAGPQGTASLSSYGTGLHLPKTIGTGGGIGGNTAVGAGGTASYSPYSTASQMIYPNVSLAVGVGGAGGGGGAGVTYSGGYGGRGAGAMYIECGGTYNFTGKINLAGEAGGVGGGGSSSDNQGNGGSGGGGGGGSLVVRYRMVSADSGTYTVTAGSGGAAQGKTSCTAGSCFSGGGGAGGPSAITDGSNGSTGGTGTTGGGAGGDGGVGTTTRVRYLQY